MIWPDNSIHKTCSAESWDIFTVHPRNKTHIDDPFGRFYHLPLPKNADKVP